MVHSKVHTQTAQQHADENTGYTYSLSSSYSSSALDYERENRLPPRYESPRMSRRSLRLHASSTRYGEDSLLDSSLNHSVIHTNEKFAQRETKTVRSRRSNRSVSKSSSLLQTPIKNQSLALQTHNSSMLSCTASDASLFSSLLDESDIQEHTVLDSLWGLDKDGGLKDQTLHSDHSLTLINNDKHTSQAYTVDSGYICENCVTRRNAPSSYNNFGTCASSSCSYSSAALHATTMDEASNAASTTFSPYTTVYTRERNRRHRAGVLRKVSEASLHYSRKAVSSVLCVFTMLMQNVLLKSCQQGKALLCSVTERCLRLSRRAATSSAAALKLPAQFYGLKRTIYGHSNGGHANYCGTMNLNEQVIQKEQLILNGPLCDDCKGKQNSNIETVSISQQLIETLWLLIVFAGSRLLKAVQDLLSSLWSLPKKTLSFFYLAAVSPGSAASSVVQWLGTAWYQLVMLNSFINIFFLTRILPILRKLLLILLPLLLLLLLLRYFGVSGFWTLPAFWPATNLTSDSTVAIASESSQPEFKLDDEIRLNVEPDDSSDEPSQDLAALSAAESERLARLESKLALLWEQVTSAGGKQEEQHSELLGLCRSLKDELHANTDRESVGQWVNTLLEEKISLLRVEIEKSAVDFQQPQEGLEAENQAQESRLARLEALLQDLALKTEKLQQRQDDETPPAVSTGDVDGTAYEALLAEVRRIENALGNIRADLQGVMNCKGRCEQLDSLQDTVSTQVRRELLTLLYGEEQAESEELPDSLMQWLSTKFVSSSDMLASLSALEKSILGNLSLQMEEMQQNPSEETITRTVLQTTERSGLSEEDVQLIVQNALKLYSEDRIGLVDYALESGGGSILSTRCSETYETKTALMSLFGFPLWYFSQSPRAVIQPDVHPGNCWAFKGSTGYLVIRLCVKIVPTAFSLEHIPKALSPTGNISSAPRNFTVYGLEDEQQEEGKVLGQYVYEEDGEALQTFQVMENTDAFQIIELRVLSNWGHPEYTCLYRFRVHGIPAEEEGETEEEKGDEEEEKVGGEGEEEEEKVGGEGEEEEEKEGGEGKKEEEETEVVKEED